MLRRRVTSSTHPWRSIRFASQLSQKLTEDRPVEATVKTSSSAEGARKPSSILSRLSDKTQSRIRRDPDTAQKNHNTHRTPQRPATTSFVSTRSAQKRDYAAEKWFTDVRELNISVEQTDDQKSLLRKRRRSGSPKQHEMRPRTDLNELFASSTARSWRLQTKKELGGDYASYLPDGRADPKRLPVAYARLVLGRNKHVPLYAQTGALSIVEEAVRGKTTGQGM